MPEALDTLLRHTSLPTPFAVEGVEDHMVGLSEGWSYSPAPAADFMLPGADSADWAAIVVPGEPAMQGFTVESDVESGYRTIIDPMQIPQGSRVFLRFDGVYSFARVWLDGTLVGTHLGGFTRFEFDVTGLIRDGEPVLLAVGVTDRSDSVSTASNYAFHNIGGILRPVSVLVVPDTRLSQLRVSTPRVDDHSATLTVSMLVEGQHASRAEIAFHLTDPQGGAVELVGSPQRVTVPPNGLVDLEFTVAHPQLWSDESPRLYDLVVGLQGDRGLTYRQRVGFRTVEVRGNQVLVNGRSVVLRGINRHDLDPLLGRSTDGSMERRDLELFRDANINFVRTSHYPPHPALLDAADELGIYVEVENSVCWAGQFGWPSTQDEEQHLSEYLGPLAEMIGVARNHPSVIIWSLGNESTWGTNFERSHALVSTLDDSRPIIMSFPGGPEDILSSHYPLYDSDLGSRAKPVLHDEVVHLPVYQSGDLRRDPGIHADWAGAIDDFVERLHRADGGLGVAIWSGVDEQFALPTGTVGFGPWGIIDVWRRRKPEWWAVRSAFSPVRLGLAAAESAGEGMVALPVENTFAFRNASELDFEWVRADGSSGRSQGPDLPPGGSGVVWVPSDAVEIRLTDAGRVIDHRTLRGEARIAIDDRRTAAEAIADAPELRNAKGAIVIGDEAGPFLVEIDGRTGVLRRAVVDGRTVVTGGPRPWVEGIGFPDWEADTVETRIDGPRVIVRVEGHAGPLRGRWELAVNVQGRIDVDYILDLAAGAVSGRLAEAGVGIALTSLVSETEWEATNPWSIAGEGFLGRPRGRARRDALPDPRHFGDADASWNDVEAGAIDRSVLDRWSRDFRAGRPGVVRQRVTDVSGAGVELRANGDQSTRIAAVRTVILPDDQRVDLVGAWRHREVAGGLNQGSVGLSDHRCEEPGARVTVQFRGTAIDCLGALGPDLGLAEVSLDGNVFAQPVDLFSPVDCSGHTIFSASNLDDGEHELTITVTGRRHAWSTGHGVRVQRFEVFDSEPAFELGVLAKRVFPVSGSFDWMDPAGVELGTDGFQAAGSFAITLLPSTQE